MDPRKTFVSTCKMFLAALAVVSAAADVVGPVFAVPASPAAPAPELRLVSLHCVTTEDVGSDHAYLLVNGVKVWGPTAMNDGDTADLRQVHPVPFAGTARLSLYDRDLVDPDDWLGDVVIGPSPAGRERTAVFSQQGAHYVLTFVVAE